MKKLLALLLSFALLLTLCVGVFSAPVSAEGEDDWGDDYYGDDDWQKEGDYYFTVTDDEATIIDYTGNETYIEIPSTLGGYPVVALGGYDDGWDWNAVFRDCKNIVSITLPKTVIGIENDAFEACTKLAEFIVEAENPRYYAVDGVLFDRQEKTLRRYPAAKYNREFAIPDGIVGIADNAFAGCENLSSLTIPASVSSIGVSAFQGCKYLAKVYISDLAAWCDLRIDYNTSEAGASWIDYTGNPLCTGADLYVNGKLLTDLVIPEGVTKISKALTFGNYVMSVSIPGTLTSITGRSLASPILSTITVAKGNAAYCAANNVLYNKDKTTLVRCPRTKEGTFAIPSTITDIGVYAFANCDGITALVLDKKMTFVCDYAFWKCDNLKDVYYNGTKAQRQAIDFSTEDPDDYDDEDYDVEQAPFLMATWHYGCKFAAIATQPKNTSAKVNQKVTVSVTVTGDGLTYNWYASDVEDNGKFWRSGTKFTNVYDITLTPERVGRKVYCVVTDKYGNMVKSNTVTLGVVTTSVLELKVSLSKTAYTYNGKVQKPTVKVTDSKGNTVSSSNYTVKYDKGCKNAGTYSVAVIFEGNYSGIASLSYKINPIRIFASTSAKPAISLSKTTYTYNGKVQKPTVTVKNASGTKLTKGTHYTVTCATGCKNVGVHKVTVKMKGNYSGTKTLTFTINPAGTSVSKLTAGSKKLTVKWTKKTTQVTGYQIQYSTSKSFKSYKTKALTSYKKTSLTLTGLKAKTTYYVRVRTYKTVNGVKYYSGWSTIKYKKTK